MMKHLLGSVAAVALLAMSANADNQDWAEAILDKNMAEFDRADAPGCSAVLTHKGEILAAKGYGLANMDHDIPNAPDTVFRIASVSKQFTAMAVRLLEEDGKLTLDDDIRKHLPELPDFGYVVTIRHMLEHSSGLPFYDDLKWSMIPPADWISKIEGENSGYYLYPFMSDSDFFSRILKHKTLHYAPGEKWAYNNIGYFLTGKIVERVSGKHIREFADERIFKPLGMAKTFFNTRNYEPTKNKATAYFRLKDGRHIEWPTDLNWVGDGGLMTTVEDLAKWDGNFYNNILGGGAALIKDMVTPNKTLQYPEYMKYDGGAALGLFVEETDFGDVVQHGGAWVGFRTHSERHMESGYGSYVLCNTEEAGHHLPKMPRGMIRDAVARAK